MPSKHRREGGISLVKLGVGVEGLRPTFPGQILDWSVYQGWSFLVNLPEFSRTSEDLNLNPQGCLFSKANQWIFSSASSLSGSRSGVNLPECTSFPSRAHDSSSRPEGVSLNLHKDHRTDQLSTQEIFNKLFFPNDPSPLVKIPSVPSPSIASPKDSVSIIEDSQGDVNTFSGFQDSSVDPVGSSEVCVLPGPSRESLTEYSARVKVLQEGLGVIAEASAPTDSIGDVSFSSQDSVSQGWSTLCPDLAGALFSGKFCHLNPGPLQASLEEAKSIWLRSFRNHFYFEGDAPPGRNGARHIWASFVASSFLGGSSVAVSTAAFQGTHSSSSFFQGSFSESSQRHNVPPHQEFPHHQNVPPPRDVPPQPFHLLDSRIDTIGWGLRRLGFSDNVIERILGSFRDSTQRTYQSAWKNFLGYLKAQKIRMSRFLSQ